MDKILETFGVGARRYALAVTQEDCFVFQIGGLYFLIADPCKPWSETGDTLANIKFVSD